MNNSSAISNREALIFPSTNGRHHPDIRSKPNNPNDYTMYNVNGKFRFKKRRERKAAIWQGDWFVFDEMSNICKCLCMGCNYTLKGRHNTTLENHLKVHHKEESQKFFRIKQMLAAEKAVVEQQNCSMIVNANSTNRAPSSSSSAQASPITVDPINENLKDIDPRSPSFPSSNNNSPQLIDTNLSNNNFSSIVFPSITSDPQSFAAALVPLFGQTNAVWPQAGMEKRWETKLAVMFAAERWHPEAIASWAVHDFFGACAFAKTDITAGQLIDLISSVHLNVTKNVETAIEMAECVQLGVHLMPTNQVNMTSEALVSIVAIFFCMASQQLESALLSVARLPCSSGAAQLAADVLAVIEATVQQWSISDRKRGNCILYSAVADQRRQKKSSSENGNDVDKITIIENTLGQLNLLESRCIYSYGAVLTELVDAAMEKDAMVQSLIPKANEIKDQDGASSSPGQLDRSKLSLSTAELYTLVQRTLTIKTKFKHLHAIEAVHWDQLNSLMDLIGPLKLHLDAFGDDESITIDKALPSLTQLIILLEKVGRPLSMSSRVQRCYGVFNSLALRLLETFRFRFAGILQPSNKKSTESIFALATSLNPALALALETETIELAQNELKDKVRQRAGEGSIDQQRLLQQALSAIDAFFDGLPLLSADVNEDALDYWLSVQGNTVNVNAADTMVLPNQLLFECVMSVIAIPASCALFRRLSNELVRVYQHDTVNGNTDDSDLEKQVLLRFNRKFIPDVLS